MTFKTYLSQSAQKINAEMNKILSSWQSEYIQQAALSSLIQEFASQCEGGKRIRGTLVMLGFLLGHGKESSDILKPAVAFEIFQTSILAHDDIIDKSPLRRGKPSLYHALGNNHYGISQTICLGDIGFFLSMELLATSNFPADIKNHALQFFSQIAQQTAHGEMLDVLMPTLSSCTETDVLAVASLKTAPYSVIGPLSLGAIFAGANSEFLSKIHIFGENLGIAYQIKDDLLGIFANQETLGKSNMSDIQEGKCTLLFSYAKTHATGLDAHILAKQYGNPSVTSSDAEKIKDIFVRTGAREYTERMLNMYIETARSSLHELTDDPKLSQLLEECISFLLKRTT